MTRLVISNQRGGVSKTTTTHSFGRFFADQGLKVLLVDTDPQGSLGMVLGVNPQKRLKDFLVDGSAFEECIVSVHPRIDIMCSNRETQKAELTLSSMTAGEFAFMRLFGMVEKPYDVVLIDVAPSINLIQTCAMIYAKQLVIPVSMDMLSLQGAGACLETTRMLNEWMGISIECVAILPTMVDRRFTMTNFILNALEDLCNKTSIPLLPPIRTDGTVAKAMRNREFLVDFDAKSKVLEDYEIAGRQLMELLNVQPKPIIEAQAPA